MSDRDFDFEKLGTMVDFVTPEKELISSYTGEHIPLPDVDDEITLAEYELHMDSEVEMGETYQDYVVESVDLHYVTATADSDEEFEQTFSIVVVTVTPVAEDDECEVTE